MLARAHKKFQRGKHSEIYLVTLKGQDKTKMELSLDIVSISASVCRTITNPSKHSEYTRSFRSKIRSIREIAKVNLEQARKRQNRQNHERNKTWKPFVVSQAVWLKRPKSWKFRPKWIRAVRDYAKDGSKLQD